jgi:hypothetical protein
VIHLRSIIGCARARRTALRALGMTVAAVLLMELIAFAAWRFYGHWRLGRIELTNAAAPLLIQVLDESGEQPIGDPIDLVTTTTLALPDGDYRLRVDGVGRLGQTYRMAVDRGEVLAHELSLEEGRLLASAPATSPRFGLESKAGGPKGRPIDMGFEPVRPLQYADLDGDGEPEVVALGRGPAKRQQSLIAFSSATGRSL